MPLAPGTRLGPYEILAHIGASGMGEVYRARDTKLGRDVALKILPAAFASSPDRLARFEREARVLASLDHPHIGPIYGLEDGDGTRALVLALIEGPTLADRIDQGPLLPDEAAGIALQIAEAFEYAHDHGVIHRDLKPANVKVTPDGVVKVLDFGLAKALEAEDSSTQPGPNSPTMLPTVTMGATQPGMILGTAAYISPEQVKGKRADRRSDIWAFGVVLYEMLVGRRPFQADSIGELMAEIVKEEPKLDSVPARFRALVSRCLTKDPRKRLQSFGEARLMLEGPATLVAEPTQALTSARARYGSLGWIAAGMFAGITTIGLGFVSYRHATEEPPPVLKMSVLPPEKGVFTASSVPAVSPDGRRLAFVATLDGKNQLWVRDLDSLEARALTGADNAEEPFWSPDSRSIGFFADGKLKKIEIAGGPALTLCDAAAGRGGTWSKDGVIVFALTGAGTFRVPAAGGSSTPLTTPDKAGGGDHRFPWFLPDGRHFLYTTSADAEPKRAIFAASIDPEDQESKTPKRIAAAASNAVYTAPGFLLFVREGTLMAQPFNASKLQATGDAVPIAEKVDTYTGKADQYQFSASQNGVLAYTSGSAGRNLQLTWFDRSGKVTGTLGAPGTVAWGAISPDGKTVAADRMDRGIYDIWLHDLGRGTASRFTFGPKNNQFPVWSPDGSRIVFFSMRDRTGHPFQKVASGTGQDEVLSKPLGEPPTATRVDDWSRDGRYLILSKSNNPKTRNDVWVLPMFGDRKPFPYLNMEFAENYARLSPDGKWLAYTSDESKRPEIYIQSFPNHGGKWQVSTNGGQKSIWSRDGKELYFVSADGKMMAVEVKSGATRRSDVRSRPAQTTLRCARPRLKYFVRRRQGQPLPDPRPSGAIRLRADDRDAQLAGGAKKVVYLTLIKCQPVRESLAKDCSQMGSLDCARIVGNPDTIHVTPTNHGGGGFASKSPLINLGR